MNKDPNGPKPQQDRRTYVGEMELALDMARARNGDRNPDRFAQVDGWLEYGLRVAIARRGHSAIPPRPKRMI